jgi:hypothetical protein
MVEAGWNPITAIDLYVSGLIQRVAGKPAGINMGEARADFDRAMRELQGASKEIERMREGWDADVDWANKLLRERDQARAALKFYAEEDSEFDAGGIDGGRRALEALGLPLGGSR